MKSGTVIGHLLKNLSCIYSLFMKRGGVIQCRVAGRRTYSHDLPQGRLEIPCVLILEGNTRIWRSWKYCWSPKYHTQEHYSTLSVTAYTHTCTLSVYRSTQCCYHCPITVHCLSFVESVNNVGFQPWKAIEDYLRVVSDVFVHLHNPPGSNRLHYSSSQVNWLNFCRRKSFAALLTLMSMGWRWSVMLASSFTRWMLSSRSCTMPSINWPLKVVDCSQGLVVVI